MHIYMYSMYINKTKTLANGLQIHRVMYVLVYYIYICKCGCVCIRILYSSQLTMYARVPTYTCTYNSRYYLLTASMSLNMIERVFRRYTHRFICIHPLLLLSPYASLSDIEFTLGLAC